jgi:DnaJ-class molecular chaperone|tara:strand:+ start:197 stop:403 length:207 start_codon:yes stop_codon:yes gene_type:complete
MEKLKKGRVRKLICPTCKGNGFVKVASFNSDEMIHQCWDCDSEGEFYETSDNYFSNSDGDDNTVNKLH